LHKLVPDGEQSSVALSVLLTVRDGMQKCDCSPGKAGGIRDVSRQRRL